MFEGNPGLRIIVDLLIFLVAVVAGGVIGAYLAKARALRAHSEAEGIIRGAETESKRLLAEAEAKAKTIELAAQQQRAQIIEEVDQESQRRRRELERAEERIQHRQESLDSRLEGLEQRGRKLDERESRIAKRQAELDALEEERRVEMERIARMTQEEARGELLAAVEQKSRHEMARKIREVEAQATAEADARARTIITRVMERVASEHIAETTVSSVPLPADEMKGRIIGRQGRNIRAIEQVTGVDLVVDDTPEAIIVSSFDPIRREVARIALGRLVQDGRIHPARIEQEVAKAQQEVDRSIRDAGEQAVIEVGLQMLHPDLVKLLGRLKYRTSYGQNQLAHAVEATHIAAMLAAEMGANVQIAKMGALLHDIGKAVSHEVEGAHAQVGADIVKRYGVPPEVVNIVASHHHEVEQLSVEAAIAATADAISGSRPGARREALETYVKRIQSLEDIGNSFAGVQQTYAIQAGREVRVIVKPEDIDDLASIRLAKEIAQKIEDGLEYPGQIKVTVVRETRAVELAK